MASTKAVIIGAGIAGIAAAIRLSVKGYTVKVFEANAYPGGKLSEVNQNGFRFDAGPSLLTLPQYIDELFELAAKKPSHYFNYHKLDVICKYFYEDGTQLTAYADNEKFIQEVTTATGELANAIKSQMANSGKIYNLTNAVFFAKINAQAIHFF